MSAKTDVTPEMFHATMLHNFNAWQSCSMQLCMSHTAPPSHKRELIELIGQFLFTRQSCNVLHALLCISVAQWSCTTKLQVWHRS